MATEEYVIQIKDNGDDNFFLQRKLQKLGFKYVEKSQRTKYWELRNVSTQQMKEIKTFCKRHFLDIEILDQRFTASSNYREEFFKHHAPVLKKYYFCIYCGRLLTRRTLQVDHIVPIHKAKTNKWVRRYLSRKKFQKGVNDYHNLGASCRKCNLSKSDKMGLWTIRGKIGKSNLFQIMRWIIRFLIIGAGITILCLYRENIVELVSKFLK